MSSSSSTASTKKKAKTLKQLGVIKPLAKACAALGIRTPTPVQEACIPRILRGENVIGAAPTGSGKTGTRIRINRFHTHSLARSLRYIYLAAFALPILQQLAKDPYGIFALVLTPTRYVSLFHHHV
jgi:ATP-dependent RNA helicase DDX49/DBP8